MLGDLSLLALAAVRVLSVCRVVLVMQNYDGHVILSSEAWDVEIMEGWNF